MLVTNQLVEFSNEFIQKVFNFYNGKINKSVRAVLKINWAMPDEELWGTTLSSGIVMIYPVAIILSSANEEVLRYVLYETVIHELSHIDQIVDYNRYVVDDEYKASVEACVEKRVRDFIQVQENILVAKTIFGITKFYPSKEPLEFGKFSHGYVSTNTPKAMLVLQDMFGAGQNYAKLENLAPEFNYNVFVKIRNDNTQEETITHISSPNFFNVIGDFYMRWHKCTINVAVIPYRALEAIFVDITVLNASYVPAALL